MSRLGTELGRRHEAWAITGLYQGYFDMTYFAVVTPALKTRGLKIAVVFDYQSFRFQVWVAARNRETQKRFWRLLSDSGWPAESLVEPAPGVDAIVAVDVADGSDLVEPGALTDLIEGVVVELLDRLERFLEAAESSS
jgi:hypothetical protein